jgi:hypothetical protein
MKRLRLSVTKLVSRLGKRNWVFEHRFRASYIDTSINNDNRLLYLLCLLTIRALNLTWYKAGIITLRSRASRYSGLEFIERSLPTDEIYFLDNFYTYQAFSSPSCSILGSVLFFIGTTERYEFIHSKSHLCLHGTRGRFYR